MIAQQIAAEGVKQIVVVSDEPDKYPAGYFAAGHRDPPPRRARCRPARAARHRGLHDPALRPDLRRREAPAPQARQVSGSGEARLHQRAGVRRLRRLRRQVELRVGRARSRPSSAASARSTRARATRTTPASTASARASSPSKAAACASREKAQAGDGLRRCRNRRRRRRPSPYGILVTGIGGTGVITIGALLGMAAHLEGKGCQRARHDRPGAEERRGHLARAHRRRRRKTSTRRGSPPATRS